MAKKVTCPVSRKQFREHAKPLPIKIGDSSFEAQVREFKPGSFGWYLGGNMTVKVAGQDLTVRIGLNLAVAGSKEAPQDANTAVAPATDVPAAPQA
jgi:hypothetical protein